MKQKERLLKILLTVVVVLTVFSTAEETQEGGSPAAESADLTIDTAELTEIPLFIDWAWEGITMQLIALKDAEGKVRLAFNTCQSCNGSPWAWFEYLEDNILECQNCGQKVSTALIGNPEAWGCAPIAISDYTENRDGGIVIPKQVFAEAAKLFTNWRKTGE